MRAGSPSRQMGMHLKWLLSDALLDFLNRWQLELIMFFGIRIEILAIRYFIALFVNEWLRPSGQTNFSELCCKVMWEGLT